jgi:DNA/RNA endonuclease G (NUC1)
MNQQIWRELEDLTRDWTELRGDSFQITGGMFYDPAEEDPATADGMVEFEQIGPGNVAVPTHFYKIIVAKRPGTNTFEAMAFVAENVGHERPFDFAGLLVSIDWLEDRTGIDFLPNLTAAEEQRLERDVSALWPTH